MDTNEMFISEEEQRKMMRRYTRSFKKERRSQGEQTHKVKTKYNRKKAIRQYNREEEEDYE